MSLSFSALETFQTDFSLATFMDKLCEGIEENKMAGAANLNEMKKFFVTIEKRVESLDLSIGSETGDVNYKLAQLENKFDAASQNFNNLNIVAEAISGTAIRVGKQLETAQFEKMRAEEAREILGYFLEINENSKCSKIDNLVSAGTLESGLRLAGILRKLNHIAKAEITGCENASKIVIEYYKKFESQYVDKFMESFNSEDMVSMKDAAAILIALNDANSCVKTFIDKHVFFSTPLDISLIKYAFFSRNEEGTRLPIDFSQPAVVEDGLGKIFDLILKTVAADWKYLGNVFDDPKYVMDKLLSKVYDEIIKVYCDELLSQAKRHSLIRFLRELSSAFSACILFNKKLLEVYEDNLNSTPATSSLSETSRERILDQVKIFLYDLHSQIFEKYVSTEKIISAELDVLKEVIRICSIPPQNSLILKKSVKASKNIFSRTMGSSAPQVIPGADILKESSLYLFKDGAPLVSPNEGEDGIIPSPVIIRLLRIVSESISQLQNLFPDQQEATAESLEKYIRALFDDLKMMALFPVLDYVVENEEVGSSSKAGFDPKNFAMVSEVNELLSLIQTFFESFAVLSVVSPVTCRRALEAKNEFIRTVVSKCNTILQLEIDGMSTVLNDSAQKSLKKSDFKPKPDDLSAFNSNTQFCVASMGYLKTAGSVARKNLPLANYVKFMSRVGKMFFELVIESIKKFSINDMGALVFLKDVNAYLAMLDEFGDEVRDQLLPYFDFLKDLANVFLVRPENLRGILQEGNLSLVDLKLFYPFISLRADFKSSNIESYFPDIDSTSFLSLF